MLFGFVLLWKAWRTILAVLALWKSSLWPVCGQISTMEAGEGFRFDRASLSKTGALLGFYLLVALFDTLNNITRHVRRFPWCQVQLQAYISQAFTHLR